MSWWRGRADARRGRVRRVARCCANRRLAVLMLALVLVPLAAPALGADVAAGRRKALQCQACHGLDGLSKLPEAPHLAGQPERYLVKSIDEFRKGMPSASGSLNPSRSLADCIINIAESVFRHTQL
jgi:mono/diheme cytochrome c family protein